jgi:hypothetical protein
LVRLEERLREVVAAPTLPPGAPELRAIETEWLSSAPQLAAACADPGAVADFSVRLRKAVKDASMRWDLGDATARGVLYRLLYASRLTLEEIALQLPEGAAPVSLLATEEPSRCPSATINGVKIHSGDLLVTRGNASTSALIARASDYPGGFSHVALAHVSEAGEVTVIESLIESGVVYTNGDEWLDDPKLRVLVLRPRSDLPALVQDPLLPHKAASASLAEAKRRHIPYDFAMNHAEPSKQFCAEVVSHAYSQFGVDLWRGITSMSGRGAVTWLASFGVENFLTHGPSDLEYDPQLRVVAEWRDLALLFSGHVDSAVIDAMLEGADDGERVGHSAFLLPVTRIVKAFSVALNLIGLRGPVPEGMSATTALRVVWLDKRHGEIKAQTLELAAAFESEHGYRPPYWQLVSLARNAKALVAGSG